jgi:hypothetical protein
MLFSEIMTKNNFERPVYSGQVVVVSYDIKSDWWHRINIWAWNRSPVARCLDEVAVIITPFHIIFGRIARTGDIATLKKDWMSIMGLIQRTFRTAVVGAEDKTWAYMYRLIPCIVSDQKDIAASRQELGESSQLEFLSELGVDNVYNTRFRHFPFYVPAVGDALTATEFAIRVGRFGQKGQHDRPRVEIRDLTGRRVIDD